ncbi:hypothetical protein L2E82_01085 [Cichorium intybus]|uniref:Uncharacterized protein n=1 Tax=Cichorium intybus TaxID=13427 RepID=A0ACB9GXW7_CICIN|nr:hypothetical protein L2E82_01085 [Cichorium intybus]
MLERDVMPCNINIDRSKWEAVFEEFEQTDVSTTRLRNDMQHIFHLTGIPRVDNYASWYLISNLNILYRQHSLFIFVLLRSSGGSGGSSEHTNA